MSQEQRTLMGAYIRRQRKLADLSMRQVSAMAGISNPYLSQIERGLRAPSEAVAAGIATALGVSVDEFRSQSASDEERTDLLDAIENATELTTAQRASLAEIYRSFVRANDSAERPADATAVQADQSPLDSARSFPSADDIEDDVPDSYTGHA